MNIVPISPNFKEAELKPNQKKNTASLHFTHFMASTANCTPRSETHTGHWGGGHFMASTANYTPLPVPHRVGRGKMENI